VRIILKIKDNNKKFRIILEDIIATFVSIYTFFLICNASGFDKTTTLQVFVIQVIIF